MKTHYSGLNVFATDTLLEASTGDILVDFMCHNMHYELLY